MSKSYNSRDLFLEIEDNSVYSTTGDYILCYQINYVEKYSQQKEDYEQIAKDWFRFYTNLPIGTIVVKSDCYQKRLYQMDSPADNFLIKSYAKHFASRPFLKHTGYLFIISPATDTFNNSSCRNPFSIKNEKRFTEKKDDIEFFRETVNQAVTLLPGVLIPICEKEILEYTDFYFNGFQNDYFTEASIEKGSIKVDEKEAGIFYIPHEKYLPDTTNYAIKDGWMTPSNSDSIFYQGCMDGIGVTFKHSHIYNQVVFLDDSSRHIAQLEKHMANLWGLRGFSSSNTTTSEKIQEVLSLAGQSEDSFRIVRGSTSVIFWAETKSEYQVIKNQVSGIFREREFKPVFATGGSLKEIFINGFFTNVSCLSKGSLYLTTLDVATSFFVYNTVYKNDDTGIIFTDRLYNIPVIYDFWDFRKKRKNSRNFAIVADTGGGKSFFTMNMLYQLFYQGVKLILLDIGGSYVKMAHLFPADQVAIINLKKGESLGENPFTYHPGDTLIDKISSVSDFVFLLLYKKTMPTDLQETSYRKLIQEYYNHFDDGHSFESFYNFIKDNEDSIFDMLEISKEQNRDDYFNFSEFIHRGREYVTGGVYASMLKVNTDEDKIKSIYEKRLIIYELENMGDESREEDKRFVQISLMAIKETIRRVVWKDRSSPAVILFDEFAKQLKNPEILVTVEYYFQAARKFNGSVGIILQTLHQLQNSAAANSMLQNTSTYVFLEKKEYPVAAKHLPFTESDKIQFQSLRSNFDHNSEINYSEVFIHTSKGKGFTYRIETSYEGYLTFQTEGDLYESILHLYSKSNNMEKSIESYITLEKRIPNLRTNLQKKYQEVKDDPKLEISNYYTYFEELTNTN